MHNLLVQGALACFLWYQYTRLQQSQIRILLTPFVGGLFAILFIVSILSTLWGVNLEENMMGPIWILSYFSIFTFLLHAMDEGIQEDRMLIFILQVLVMSTVIALMNIAMYLYQMHFKFAAPQGAAAIYRASLVIEYANTLAVMSLICCFYCVYLLWKYAKHRIVISLAFSGIFVHLLHIIITFSRAVWLLTCMAILGFLGFTLIKRKNYMKKLLLTGAIFLCVIGFSQVSGLIKQRVQSIDLNATELLERVAYYQDAMTIFKDYWVLGTGFWAGNR